MTRTTRGRLIARVTALVATALSPVWLLPAATTSATSTPDAQYAKQAFVATNDQRADNRAVRLKQDDCLQRFAASHAQRLASQRRIFHQNLDRVLRGCRLRTAGENVAYGFPTGSATVRAWMSSPGHRANILDRSYRHMAVAAQLSSDGRWYVVQLFGAA